VHTSHPQRRNSSAKQRSTYLLGVLKTLAISALIVPNLLITPSTFARTPDEVPRIAFAAYRNGQWDLYSVDETGADLRQLTDDIHQDRDPAYSPDGTQLAFASRQNQNWDIFLLDLNSGQQTRLTNHPHYDGAPAWHPDGTKIAFESFRAGDLDIWILDLASGALTNLTADTPSGDFAPAWSPDGTKIAFTSWRRGDKDLFAIHLKTGALTQLTNSEAAEEWPAWSPDGTRLAFVKNWLGEREVHYMAASAPAADGGPVTQLTWLARGDSPVWSPEGERLAVLHHRFDGEQLLWFTPGEGSQLPTRLTEVAWLAGRPAWSSSAVNFGNPLASLASTEPSPLYTEDLTPSQSGEGEPWDLLPVADLDLPTPAMTPYLSDRVDDSYIAFRRRLADEVGYDFLGQVSEATRPYDFFNDTSEYASWHKSGRAIDTLFEYRTDNGQMTEIVRDDMGGETYWRLLLRCADQSGVCGRPVTVNAWDYSYRARSEIAPDQGGIEKQMLHGYYVDFTALAREYGWTRISSWNDEDFSWTWHFKAFEYWHYQKTDGLPWYAAMQEVYPPNKLERYFTYEQMLEVGDYPFLIALKGVPLPTEERLRWAQVRP
jgi:TolB protein